jgi:hypothetical protein
MRKIFPRCILIVCLVCYSLSPATANAINLGAAYKSDPGYKLKLYSLYYGADTHTNKDGKPDVNDLGLRKYGVSIGNSYQAGDFQFDVIIPVSKIEVDKLKKQDSGLGDILVAAGWFLPVEWANIMPAVGVKIPTGNFDRFHLVNNGDGQTDLLAGVYFFKLMQPLSYNAVVKYNFRFRNPDSDFTPGNEFSAEGLMTLRLVEGVRIGPAVNFVTGADNKKGGKILHDSGLMRLSAGGEIYFGKLEKVKISLAAYQDVLTRNTYEGVTAMSRIIVVF